MVETTKNRENVLDRRLAVRCRKCGRIILYKVSQTSGLIEWKCSRCGDVRTVDLALKRKTISDYVLGITSV